MKPQIFIVTLILLTACIDRQGKTTDLKQRFKNDTLIKHDTIFTNNEDWQKDFGLTHNPQIDSIWGEPVNFYINNPKCAPIAIDFYWGQFRPTDNDTSTALLLLVTTNDHTLRPFYRWCLNKTIQIQDGALGEMTGVPARQYAEKFPKEFFEYMDFDTTGDKYLDWVDAISYSGFYDSDDYEKPQDIRNRMAQTMKENCKQCSEQLKKRIDQFAKDCYH